jgi:tetratricopeptide (TPR) repeat protein
VTRFLLSLLLLFTCAVPCLAVDGPTQLWNEGVQAANSGDYRKALDRFESIRNQGYGGEPLLYNLGNCYQRLGNKGEARAAYEQARRLAPWDGDVAVNLARLRSTLDDTEPDPSALSALAEQFPRSALALAFTGLQLLFWGTYFVYRRSRRELHFWLSLSVFGLWLGCGLLLWTRMTALSTAAILPESIVLKNGPGKEFTDSVNLHAGTLVKILSHQGDWVEVEALGRVKAFIRQDDLAPVDQTLRS